MKKGLDYLSIAKRPDPPEPKTMNPPSKNRAFQLFDSIYSLVSELPDVGKALRFGDNAISFVDSVKGQLEENGYVTPQQITALENFQDGLKRWFD